MSAPTASQAEGGRRRGWHVVGVAGVTGGGKTTLAASLLAALPSTVVCVSQDEYLLPTGHPAHPEAPPEVGGPNKETLSSVNVAKMVTDLENILASDPDTLTLANPSMLHERGQVVCSGLAHPRPPPRGCRRSSGIPAVLVIEGFLIFDVPEVVSMCDLRYCLTLTQDQCWARRSTRTFTRPFLASRPYFELCLWPGYQQSLSHITTRVPGVHLLDGSAPPSSIRDQVVRDVMQLLEEA